MSRFFDNYEKVDCHNSDSPKAQMERGKIMMRNKVLVYLNELSDNELEKSEPEAGKKKAKEPAKFVVDYFEENQGANLAGVVKYKSARCLYVYLKCLWLTLTDRLLLETEQMPAISFEDWKKIHEICKLYLKCFGDRQDYRVNPAVLLLCAYYNWVFNPDADYITDIGNPLEICSSKLGSQAIFVRLGVCKEDGKLCSFKVGIDLDGNGKCTASVDNKIPLCDNRLSAHTRKKIYIPMM